MDLCTAPELYGGIISSACNIQGDPKPGNKFIYFFFNLIEKKRSLSLSHLCQIFHVICDLD